MLLTRRSTFAVVAGLVLLTFGQHRTAAQESGEVPKIILSGFDAYKAEGPDAALKAWVKGGPVDGSKDALSQANVLRQVQDYYGTYKAFDLIRVRTLTPTTRILYFVIDFEKGPLFAKFIAYRTDQGWIITYFTFNTKDEIIIPVCP